MNKKNISQKDYNKTASHPLQSYEWGLFREKMGVKVVREGMYHNNTLVSALQMTLHPLPKTPWNIGYFPKGDLPTKEMMTVLREIGKREKCIFIQIEPNVIQERNGKQVMDKSWDYKKLGLQKAAHPLFTKYTFVLDLTKTEDELLKNMHPKGRYNIKVAAKHNVLVKEDNSQKAFDAYWKLTKETTTRQKFYAHTKQYHQTQFDTLPHTTDTSKLTSHLFTASYDNQILTTLLFFVFKDTLYYPYGASSNLHRNVMHSNAAMWEGIRFGKKLGLKKFDMWGAMSIQPDTKDPWYGFHNFKEKFGPEHNTFVGSYDLVLNPLLYTAYKAADKLRWLYLKMKK